MGARPVVMLLLLGLLCVIGGAFGAGKKCVWGSYKERKKASALRMGITGGGECEDTSVS